jgi:hypothetical protein
MAGNDLVDATNFHESNAMKAEARRYDWNSHTCATAAAAAADKGHLTCLKWANENGCNWDRATFISAAANGHLSCLQWARENGYDWDTQTCYPAALNGQLSCFRWARDN